MTPERSNEKKSLPQRSEEKLQRKLSDKDEYNTDSSYDGSD